MASEIRLISAASLMAHTAPDAWAMFLQALETRATEASEQLVSSDPVTLQINQGRAQAYRAIYHSCRDAVKKQAEVEQGRR